MQKLPAVFMRGGTSKALIFHTRDLPEDRSLWDAIFLASMGSPDPNGRQLDGLGGGISSLSKVCIVGPPTRPDADIDYTFAQVQVDTAVVDYAGNCGNMSSAIGPFAVDEGLVQVSDGNASVRVHNTNTNKVIVASFGVEGGKALAAGDYAIDGVAGTGAPVRLDFLDPGGAATGRLLPTGHVSDTLELSDGTPVEVSMVDAANPCVFLRATDLGLTGTELPEALEADPGLSEKLEQLRRSASVAMGIADSVDAAARNRLTPFIALVGPPQPYSTLSKALVSPGQVDVVVRFLSSGRPHRAIPVTGAMCTAIASQIPGTTVHSALGQPDDPSERPIRLGTPSGILDVNAAASVRDSDGADLPPAQYRAEYASTYRTTRRLFEGFVYAPVD
ncbi:2-methylaconitate cis-trans isomerase PrpF family protein [Pseudarthrobacter sp. B4EP4b]|uniref:2-methylaconitate cis-trans isomerase PrpF family protein n=1 Tax=Pseudarthrobacter sp. B4EP4b TaxID=2590664 RepID=UPI00114F314F|nr:PrpF domain-containing protein [Pseudarthrobacter sp. B4EP4b]